MALEELLLVVRSIYDRGGFQSAQMDISRLEATTARMGPVSAQALGEAEAHAGGFGRGLIEPETRMQRLNNTIQQIGPTAATAFTIALAAIAVFAAFAVDKALDLERSWSVYSGSIGATTPGIRAVKSEFGSLFQTIADGTAHTQQEIIDVAGQLSLLGLDTSVLGMAANDVAVISNLRFHDMSKATETYNKAIEGSGMGLRALGITLTELGYSQATWLSMSKEQRAAILDSYLKEHGWIQANDDYLNSAPGKLQTIKDKISEGAANFGEMALQLLATTGILDTIIGLLDWFNNNKGAQEWVVAITGIGTAILGIVSAMWVLTKLKTMFDDVTGAIRGVLEKIGVLNNTPCTPKNCNTTTTSSGGGGSTALNAIAGITIAAATVYLTAEAMQWSIDKFNETQPSTPQMGSLKEGTSPFVNNSNPLFSGILGQGAGGLAWSILNSLSPESQAFFNNPLAGNPWDISGAIGGLGSIFGGSQGMAAAGIVGGVLGGWEQAKSSIENNPILGQINSTAQKMFEDAKGFWDKSTGWITHNNILGSITSTAQKMYNDAVNLWNNTTKWIMNNTIVGSIWSTAQSMYNDAVNWWNQLKAYIESLPIIGTVVRSVTGAGGDEQSMLENASLTHAQMASITPAKENGTAVVHNHNWNIGTIDSKETADYFADKVVKVVTDHLEDINDVKGR